MKQSLVHGSFLIYLWYIIKNRTQDSILLNSSLFCLILGTGARIDVVVRLKVTALSAQIPCSLDATSKCLLALGKGDREGEGKAREGHQLLLCIHKVV